MTDTTVPAGSSSAGIIVSSGDTLTIANGGVATSTQVYGGGSVYDYGSAKSGTLSGGTDSNGNVIYATETVYAGGSASNDVVSAYGLLNVYGTATSESVKGALGTSASETIYAGGVDSGSIIGVSAYQFIQAGGTADNDIISGGRQYLSSGATASGTILSAKGFQYVYAGANVSGTIVSSGGTQTVGGNALNVHFSGGVVTGTIVSSGGIQLVGSGGLTVSTTVYRGGLQSLSLAGSANYTVLSGGSQTVANSGSIATGTKVILGGQTVEYGAIASGTTVSGGSVNAISGGTVIGALLNGGSANANGDASNGWGVLSGTVVSSGTVNLGAYGSSYDTLLYAGTQETVSGGGLASATTLLGNAELIVLSGGGVSGLTMNSGSELDLRSLAFTSGESVNLLAGNELTVTSGGTVIFQTQLAGDYTGDYFHVVYDNFTTNIANGVVSGTLIYEDTTPCYCPGTLIATGKGEVLVEDLAIGDKVLTFSGEMRAIKWIGYRGYGGRFTVNNRELLPVCFKAGSIAENVPKRDLWVSPHHAMYLNDLLIEAKDLVNGLSIVQAGSVDSVTYYHVELDSHDVILAEGAWAESFIDDDSRGIFHNAQDYYAMYPNEEASAAGRYCAPRLESGAELEAIRNALDIRAIAGFRGAQKSVA